MLFNVVIKSHFDKLKIITLKQLVKQTALDTIASIKLQHINEIATNQLLQQINRPIATNQSNSFRDNCSIMLGKYDT